jgi:hypothetical protein
MSDLTKELLDLERQLWDANLAGDGSFYADRLRDDALVVSPWGIQDRDATVAGITANRNPYTAYHLTGPVSVPLGPDAAILTYRAEVQGTNDGGPFTHTVYATSAYARENGRWRPAFHQQTLMA